MAEVKKFNAYLLWEARKWEGNSAEMDIYPERHYSDACKELYRSFRILDKKEVEQEFKKVDNYLNTNYLANPQGRKELIKMKAYWYLLCRQRCDPETEPWKAKEDWGKAETFVEAFYDHIIPAVVERNEAAVRSVLKALQWNGADEGYKVVNAFEATVAIQFLDAKIIKKAWPEGQDVLL